MTRLERQFSDWHARATGRTPRTLPTHPDVPNPAVPVVVVTGPPGAGKSTWVAEQAQPGDTIIDLDECFREVCGVHGHEANRAHLAAALDLRNAKLAALASQESGRAFFIVGAPTERETRWWCDQLGATHVLIDPGLPVCLKRISGARKAEREKAARNWYAARAGGQWAHPRMQG